MRQQTLRVGLFYGEETISYLVTLLAKALGSKFTDVPVAVYEPALAFYVTQFQLKCGLRPDGIVGKKTWAKLDLYYDRPVSVNTTESILDADGNLQKKYQLPNYSQQDMKGSWGQAGEANLVRIDFPYQMRLSWDTGTRVKRSRVHKLVKDDMVGALEEVLDYYGLHEIQRLGLDLFGGIYNYRKMRGGNSLSSHSWAVSLDVDTAGNPFRGRPRKTNMARPSNKAFCDIMVKYGFRTLGYDLQHWQHTVL